MVKNDKTAHQLRELLTQRKPFQSEPFQSQIPECSVTRIWLYY